MCVVLYYSQIVEFVSPTILKWLTAVPSVMRYIVFTPELSDSYVHTHRHYNHDLLYVIPLEHVGGN